MSRALVATINDSLWFDLRSRLRRRGAAAIQPTGILERAYRDWFTTFAPDWRQGEHVAIIGQTGSGKTTLAGQLLDAREYVVCLAVKRHDDTLKTFSAYDVIKKWPPRYDVARCVVWLKPESLDDIDDQARDVHGILNHVFVDGGWALFLDDTGYLAGQLRLHKAITVLLNQGRSSGISVVSAMTQPSSVTARIPSEALRQVRHILGFRYRNRRDIQAIADITGYDRAEIETSMRELGPHDFLAFSRGRVELVRNTTPKRKG